MATSYVCGLPFYCFMDVSARMFYTLFGWEVVCYVFPFKLALALDLQEPGKKIVIYDKPLCTNLTNYQIFSCHRQNAKQTLVGILICLWLVERINRRIGIALNYG